jgi:hypothetical protein
MNSNKVILKTRNSEHTYYISREIFQTIKKYIEEKTLARDNKQLERFITRSTSSSIAIPYGFANSIRTSPTLSVSFSNMNIFKKELYDAYLRSMEKKQVIKVKGETNTAYRIVLKPNALPYCSCPSYKHQSFSEIKGCCKHLYKFFYTIDVDITKYNWASRQ